MTLNGSGYLSAGASHDHGSQPLRGEIDFAFQGNESLQLEEVGPSQRAEGYLVRRSVLEAMPGVLTQPLPGDVGNGGSYIEALTWEADPSAWRTRLPPPSAPTR